MSDHHDDHSASPVGPCGKRPYSKPVLHKMDASETATGPEVFTQEVLVYYTPPS
jgi:hypothetical protein